MISIFSKSVNSKIIVWVILIVGLTGCQNREINTGVEDHEEVEIINMDPGKASNQRLEDIIEEVKFMKLQMPEDVFFVGINKIVFKNKRIYILDISDNGNKSRIFCFDMDGNLEYMLDKQGKGPGEYKYIYDISVTEKSLVLSVPGGRIMFYNNSNGAFLKTEKVPDKISTQIFEMMDDHTFAATSGRYKRNTSHKQLKIYDLNEKKIIQEALGYDSPALKLGHSYRYLYYYRDTLSCLPMYGQTIYRIVKQKDHYKIDPAYKLDFGKYWIDEEILNTSYDNRERFFDAMDKYVHTVDVFETDQILYLYYRYRSKDFVFIYSKAGGNPLNISSFTNNKIGWKDKPMTSWNNYLVTIITPLEMEMGDFQSGGKYREIFSEIEEEAVPLMIFVKFISP